MSYYVFIVSSLNHPIYRKIHKTRRTILENLKIPYTVLLNAEESPMDDTSTSTLIPTDDDEILFPVGEWIPTMTQKFLMAVRQYFRSFQSEDDIPDYIVRLNATVFVYHPKLSETLETLPKTRVVAGPMYSDDGFIVGMLMIFSKDVLMNILRDPDIFRKDIMSAPDDVALTNLARKYADGYNLMENFVYPDGDTLDDKSLFDLKKIDPWANNKWYFRICDWGSHEREKDKQNFDLLANFFYPRQITTSSAPKSKRRYTNILCACLIPLFCIITLAVCWFVYKHTRQSSTRSLYNSV